jgi:hypothetical protein
MHLWRYDRTKNKYNDNNNHATSLPNARMNKNKYKKRKTTHNNKQHNGGAGPRGESSARHLREEHQSSETHYDALTP